MSEAPILIFVGKTKIMELYNDHLVNRFQKPIMGSDQNRIVFYDQITGISYQKAGFFGLGRLVLERHDEHGLSNVLSMNAIEFKKSQNAEALDVKAAIENLILDSRRH